MEGRKGRNSIILHFDAALEAEAEKMEKARLGKPMDVSDLNASGEPENQQYVVPDVVKNFIEFFFKALKERNSVEINVLYENTYNKLTERFFKACPWPPLDTISPLVDDDETFMTLYRELYYRHIYSKLTPTLEQRFDSFANYCKLFNMFLASPAVALELPLAWLWDMVDEFIYQFQAFHQHRAKLKVRPEEVDALRARPDAWSLTTVLSYLRRLTAHSGVRAILESGEEILAPVESEDDPDRPLSPNTMRALGYFAIIGVARVHCLLGDYHRTLQTLAAIDTTQRGLYTAVTACHITAHYYTGFAALMLRRPAEAIRAFTAILVYLARTRQYHTRSYQYEQIIKKNEQMYALLSIALVLSPQRVDEHLHAVLREKYGEKTARMQRGEESAFEELFCFACPKFINPTPPPFDEHPAPPAVAQEAYRLQQRLFMREVREQAILPVLRSFLRLYVSLPSAKLAKFMGVSEDALREYACRLKHKTLPLAPLFPAGSEAPAATSTDVDFFIAKDAVVVSDSKAAHQYHVYFLRHLLKTNEILAGLRAS